jgi:hypothetical protein
MDCRCQRSSHADAEHNIRRVVLGVIRSCSEQAANLGVGEPTTQPLLDTPRKLECAPYTPERGACRVAVLSGFQIQPNGIFIVAVGENLESAIVMLHFARTGKPS